MPGQEDERAKDVQAQEERRLVEPPEVPSFEVRLHFPRVPGSVQGGCEEFDAISILAEQVGSKVGLALLRLSVINLTECDNVMLLDADMHVVKKIDAGRNADPPGSKKEETIAALRQIQVPGPGRPGPGLPGGHMQVPVVCIANTTTTCSISS
eukprot:5142202-Pyramimonas_sp.AAC.1